MNRIGARRSFHSGQHVRFYDTVGLLFATSLVPLAGTFGSPFLGCLAVGVGYCCMANGIYSIGGFFCQGRQDGLW